MKLTELPKESEDDNFIYNTREEKGDKIRLSTYDKKNKKYSFDICYKVSEEGYLTQISDKDYDGQD